MKSHHLLTIPILINSLGANAEVILDGSLGRSGALPGPDYLIGADLGQQRGGNLFHSFQNFNLNRLESATFSGPNSINNIISRVTGGNPSNIDGLIRSTIPADMYFLNPNGIMFGPNARLDVQGSFHASTADYLRLGENGRFDARNPSNSLLTVAPIASFGFLSDSPTSIILQDSTLSVVEGKTLSLIGGDLNISGELLSTTGLIIFNREFTTQLSASFGRINLVSVASKSEITPTEFGLDISSGTYGGQITIKESKITTSGRGGGDIFIRAEKFKFLNGGITGNTLIEQNGGIIDIQADDIVLDGMGVISHISSNTFGSGNGGVINLSAKQFELKNGVLITNFTTGTGTAGSLYVKATNLEFSGKYLFEILVASGMYSSALGSGKGGNIEIEADNLTLTNGAIIGSGTFGPAKSGNVNIKITDNLILSGKNDAGLMSGIYASSQPIITIDPTYNTGNAGNITVEAGKINISNGGKINSSSYGLGNAGVINVKVKELVASGKLFGSYRNEYSHSGIASSSTVADEVGGQAGKIIVEADTIHLINEAEIATSAANSGGGNIDIRTNNLIYLQGGKITTSVQGGIGNGGNIKIENPTFVIMDNGKVKAQADEGHGGNIHIKSGQFIATPKSLVSASSKLGIDGEVRIDSPDVDVAGALLVLPASFVDASGKLKPPCSAVGRNNNTFVVKRFAGGPSSPSDLQSSVLVLVSPEDEKKTVQKNR